MTNQPIKDAVFIIDGSSFLYRAYYSIRPLTAPGGIPVQAVYGFCRMIKKLIDTYSPKYMVLVWDSRGKTVRHDLYPQYKETRQAAPSDLTQQKELIKEFADLIGLTQLQLEATEADDLMYSMAKQLEQENYESILITSDKDLRQTLTDKISILDPFQDKFVTPDYVLKKLEFPVEKLCFYYALIGDSSDNIPGVKGVGPKTAQELVKQFDSLEQLYEKIDTVKSERVRRLLIEDQQNAFLSRELFTLRFYDTYLTRESCSFDAQNWKNARPLFEKLEFKSLVKALGQQQEAEPKEEVVSLATKYTFKTVRTSDELNELCNQIKKFKRCALDTEADGLNPLDSTMVGISICVEEGVSYYIPFGHQTGEPQLPRDKVIQMLKPYLEDESIEKYLHHAKFDALMLYNAGIELRGIVFDTIIAASLLVGDGERIGLKYLSQYYLKEPMLKFEDVVKKNKYSDFSQVPLDLATEYAAADAHQTMKLYTLFEKGLKEHNLSDLFHKLEMPLLHVLYKMETCGIKVDQHVLNRIYNIVTQEVNQLRTEIIDLIGHQFSSINLNSPKQLEELLFTHLQLPAIKKTTQKTGYSTDQEVLYELSKLHPVPALIMRYRELYKLKSTYLEPLGTYINPKSGRVHTTFSQIGVATGRLASSEPNLQNIPVDRHHIRSAFKAKEGSVFLSADYSQIELRVLGYVSQDATLLKAFKENQDIHALTAAGLFDVPLAQVTNEQRQVGKRINFSILYGLTPHGLSKDLDISYKLAKTYIDKYMAQYPGVSAWMETVVQKTKEKGYVETFWGRRRYLPGIYERNKTMYDLARRVAINTVAQGTAAELVKWGMINLDKALIEHNLHANMLLQIHDELLLEVPQDELEKTEQLVRTILQDVVNWNVPLVVTVRTGSDWQEVTK